MSASFQRRQVVQAKTYDAFQLSVREPFICSEFCTLTNSDPHWRLMCLELLNAARSEMSLFPKQRFAYPADTHPLACKTNCVDRLTNPDCHCLFFQLFVESNEELWIHRRNNPVQHPMCFVKND
jgi:hypothetical protein